MNQPWRIDSPADPPADDDAVAAWVQNVTSQKSRPPGGGGAPPKPMPPSTYGATLSAADQPRSKAAIAGAALLALGILGAAAFLLYDSLANPLVP